MLLFQSMGLITLRATHIIKHCDQDLETSEKGKDLQHNGCKPWTSFPEPRTNYAAHSVLSGMGRRFGFRIRPGFFAPVFAR
jgi:hypothetical protein